MKAIQQKGIRTKIHFDETTGQQDDFFHMMENHKKRQYELLCSSAQIKGSFYLDANSPTDS